MKHKKWLEKNYWLVSKVQKRIQIRTIYNSDVKFSAVVPISLISIRLRIWNLETPTIRQFVFNFIYAHTWY